MKRLLYILVAILLTSCASKRPAVPQVVPIKTMATMRIVHDVRLDTTHISLPRQTAQATTLDSCSHLETDVAVSEARINADGSLRHTLENKQTPLPVVVPVTHDTITLTEEIPVLVPDPYEVEMPLSRWQEFRLKAFWYLVLGLLVMVIFVCRKPLVSLIRKLI